MNTFRSEQPKKQKTMNQAYDQNMSGQNRFLTMESGTRTTSTNIRSNRTKQRDLRFRRMRSIIILMVVMIIAGISVSEAYEPTRTISVTVSYGDTLWSIASEINEEHHDDSMDIRELVYDIQKFNGLESAMIQPGMVLEVPLN